MNINSHSKDYTYLVESFSNYDGDSMNIIVSRTWDFGFEETVKKTSPINVRNYGVDTPELRGGTVDSKAAARLAKDFVHDWLQQAYDEDALYFVSHEYKKGKFGRALGDFYNSKTEQYLNQTLILERLAVEYHGQSKSSIQAAHKANIAYLKETGKI